MAFHTAAKTKPIHVAFVGPAANTSSYWQNVIAPMPAVAKQLNIHLTFHHPTYEQRFNLTPIIETILSADNKPDYLISVFRGTNAIELLTLIEKYKTPFISISAGAPLFQQNKIGKPQENFKYWLSQIVADDINSGQVMAAELFKQAREIRPDQPVRLLAIGGNKIFEASRLRDIGLQQEIAKHPKLDFLQLVHTQWNTETAKTKTRKLLNRHKDIDVIWTANWDIAQAVYTIVNNGSRSHLPIIGTVDWTNEAFTAINNNQLAFSLGSNHLHGLWALIIFHDLAQGHKPTSVKDKLINTPYIKVDKNNVTAVQPFLVAEYWQNIDIKIYSKVFNKNLKDYNFDFNQLLIK